GDACTAGVGCGGGGGGSWAREASLDDAGAPVHGTSGGSPAGTSGAVMLTFDICAVDPDNADYCVPGAVGVTAAHAQIELVRRGNRLVRLWLRGSATFDVRDLDLSRLRILAGMQPLRGLWRGKARDRNKDGFADLRFDLSRDATQPASLDALSCVYGARLTGSPFVGCARPQTVAQLRAAAKAARR
ncbi:hypothetical protein K2Z84_09115, partial [Candidatus Binatia bacterium]|nr:hypothetical protein [Candidatus Binatia bacterium]